MYTILNKITIKQKITLVAFFAILWLIGLTIGSNYATNLVKDNFHDMGVKELWLKNTTQKIATNVSSLNRLIVSDSIAEEVSSKTLESIKTYNNNTLDAISSLIQFAQNSNDNHLLELMNKIKNRYNIYYQIAEGLPKAFEADVDDGIDEIIGMAAIANKMNKEIEQLITISEQRFNQRVKDVDDIIVSSNQVMVGSSIIGIFLFIIFTAVFIKSILNSINQLDEGVSTLLNGDKITTIEITTKDEVANITKKFNQYIKNIKAGLEEDALLIQEAQVVMNRASNGWYTQYIERSTSNKSLNDFKNDVNNMLSNTQQHFTDMNKVLEKYVDLDYTEELRLDNIEQDGGFCILVKDINELRNSITKMLIDNQLNGVALQSSSDSLLSNVETLNKNSLDAATSLEETAASLEQITQNIRGNTHSVVNMAEYGKKVKDEVSKGQQLATQTTQAMNDINSEVTSISDAIAVIDQIAFQTNILSLNAAVEAATAGEAGKGFAVVAQEVRNLASRSAEAANEIKTLVQNATSKANVGKKIADQMIDGYEILNDNITQTIELIDLVEVASKEQQGGIEQINHAISQLDTQTQQNANVANQTKDIAQETDSIAMHIVNDANTKEFIGKK